jgi:tetratricopeptide (TPR) repeat protein
LIVFSCVVLLGIPDLLLSVATAQTDAANELERLWETGNRLNNEGHYREAISTIRQLLELQEQTYGPDHPGVTVGLFALGRLLTIVGDYAAARPLFERALRIQEQTLGPDHLRVALTLAGLVISLHAAGEADVVRELELLSY